MSLGALWGSLMVTPSKTGQLPLTSAQLSQECPVRRDENPRDLSQEVWGEFYN